MRPVTIPVNQSDAGSTFRLLAQVKPEVHSDWPSIGILPEAAIASKKGKGGSWGELPPFVARGKNRENSY